MKEKKKSFQKGTRRPQRLLYIMGWKTGYIFKLFLPQKKYIYVEVFC